MGRICSALTWLCAVTVLLSAALAPVYVWCVTLDGAQMELATGPTGEECDHGHGGFDHRHASWVVCDECVDHPLAQVGVLGKVLPDAPQLLLLATLAAPTFAVVEREPLRLPPVLSSVAPDRPVLKRTVSLLI